MILIALAVALGVFAGICIPWDIPASMTPYVAIGLLAACNTLFGGIAAMRHRKFDTRAFISGFFFNTILAMLLTIAGAKLGVDFSLAAIVYFGTRIFNNLAKIQHSILQKESKGVKINKIDNLQLFDTKNLEKPFSSDDENRHG